MSGDDVAVRVLWEPDSERTLTTGKFGGRADKQLRSKVGAVARVGTPQRRCGCNQQLHRDICTMMGAGRGGARAALRAGRGLAASTVGARRAAGK
jgi:hypothetical protein